MENRQMKIPPNKVVVSSYVDIHNVVLDCKARLAVGDVERAYRKRLSLGSSQPYPTPVGYWKDGRFHIQDGRHEYVAALMLGYSHILVSYLE